jgi:hypothetical protein
MDQVPRIASVNAIAPATLLVAFRDGSERIYDCSPLLQRPGFQLLSSPAFFHAVHVDPGGYGISWNDEIDLSEYELWTRGKPVAAGSLGAGGPSEPATA